MKKTKSKKSEAWFVAVRGSYLPATYKGLAVYLIYVTYVVALAVNWCVTGRNIRNLLVNVIPLSVAAAAVTQYIASKHSGRVR